VTPDDGPIYAQAALSGAGKVGAETDVWPALAKQHLWNALCIAALCKTREDGLIAQGKQNIDYEVRGLAMVAIAAAAAFVESLINEVFRAAQNSVGSDLIAGIPPAVVETMGALWDPPAAPEVQRSRWCRAWAELRGIQLNPPKVKPLRLKPTLDKYEAALEAVGQPKVMPKGQGTWQQVRMVFNLRNALVHYTPEWQGVTANQVSSQFNQVPTSRQTPHAGFPSNLLNADAARWACDVCRGFVVEWSAHMGLTSPIDTNFQAGDWPTP
jgi:hypothetical protein